MRWVTNSSVVLGAASHPQILWCALPRAPSEDMLPAVCRVPRTGPRGPVVVAMPAVRYPFCDAPSHVVQPERVGLHHSDPERLLGIVRLAATFAGCNACDHLVAPPIACTCSATGGVLPLYFARQPVGTVGGSRQPTHVLLCILPTDIRD